MSPPYTSVDLVLSRLRLGTGDVDAARVARCAEAANDDVEEWIRPVADPPWPPLPEPFPARVVEAATGIAVRYYRFKDVEVDNANVWGDAAPLRIPRRPIEGYVDVLAPYRPGAAWCPA